MRILILGSGGREHALAWKLCSEIGKENVFIAPGNGGTLKCGSNVNIALGDFESIARFIADNSIDVLLPGSEEPIAAGIRDFIEKQFGQDRVFVLSPDKVAGQLESSKSFSKEFMKKYGIPTAAYGSFDKTTLNEAVEFLYTLKPPYVLKADGLAAGKGVLIIDELSEAVSQLDEMFSGKFGSASERVLIEEFLDGIEFSVFALTDGFNYVILPEAKDYKRIGEGNTGLNTGGMGAVSPVPFYNAELEQKTIEKIIEPTINGLKAENLNYRGFIFFGLINVNGEPKVIEYNVRMGDPETEVVIPRMNEKLSDLIDEIRNNKLESHKCDILKEYCCTVVSVAGGYPLSYKKGDEIRFQEDEPMLFHAGTKMDKGLIYTSGGRVLASTAFGSGLADAVNKAYLLNQTFEFSNRYFRKDIGKDLLQLEKNGSI